MSHTLKALYDVPAPAKLNLFLHITGRRDDGYHLLQSVFMLIDWCDTLQFELRPDGGLSREDLTASPQLPADDLCLRAARALQEAGATSLGAHIGLKKVIPAQAGMGGGSSDAASCLLALNRLWGLNLPLSRLMALGLRLGADVPFFLSCGHAWVEGIGEKITPVELPSARFVVVKPQAGLETAAIFGAADLKRDSSPAILSGFAASGSALKFGFGRNDLQPVAQRLCPGVTQALQWLASKGLSGRMTGSGSAVFAQVEHPVNLDDAPGEFEVHQCNNLASHPLSGWAPSDN